MSAEITNSALADKIDSIIRFFLYVLIFWLPYSPAVVEVCVILSLVLWIIKRCGSFLHLGWSAFRLKASCLNRPIGFFLMACILSVSASAFWQQSAANFITKTLEWFIVYFLVLEVFTQKKHIRIALGVFLFTAFSTALDSFVQFYWTHKDIFLGHVIEPGTRATAGFKTPNGLAGYLTIAISVSLSLMFIRWKHLIWRIAVGMMSCCLIWSLVLTSSRGACVGLGSTLMFGLLMYVFLKERKKFYWCVGALLVVGIFGFIFLAVLNNSSGVSLITRYETVQWRLNLWQEIFGMIQDKPLFGHGINTFMRVFQAYRHSGESPTYAHNCFIQLIAETGLVGFFTFLWIMIEIFRKTFLNIRIKWNIDHSFVIVSLGLLAGIFAFLVHSFFDTNWYSLQLSVYFWGMVGILMSVQRILEEGYGGRGVTRKSS